MGHVVHVRTSQGTSNRAVHVKADQGASAHVNTGGSSGSHTSYIDETTGTWWIYDQISGQYYDTGIQGDGSTLSLSGVSDEFVISDERILHVNKIDYAKIDGIEALEEELRGMIADIPIATTTTPGLVMANESENGVLVDLAGVMTVGNINVNKLVQTAGERFTLNAGDSTN